MVDQEDRLEKKSDLLNLIAVAPGLITYSRTSFGRMPRVLNSQMREHECDVKAKVPDGTREKEQTIID